MQFVPSFDTVPLPAVATTVLMTSLRVPANLLYNWTPGIFQIADMVAKDYDFHATFNVHGGFSNINLDL